MKTRQTGIDRMEKVLQKKKKTPSNITQNEDVRKVLYLKKLLRKKRIKPHNKKRS